jgi:hypothetical protein
MAQSDTEILEELLEQFDYGTKEWDDIREEGDINMRCLAGDVWDPEERADREEKKRPCLSLDELTQYVNQLINDIRASKRGIVVTPKGTGANDKTAEFRQGLMRQIEYESNAQQAAYIIMAENAIQRGYGFLRIKAEYVSDRSFDQRLLLEPIPDPNSVTIDPDIIRTDGKDMRWGFQRETRSTKEFKREFPYAEIQTFGEEVRKRVGLNWLNGERISVANYWRIEYDRAKLLQLELPGLPPATLYEKELEPLLKQLRISELPKGAIVKERMVNLPRVRQYLTNGIELLRPEDQDEAYVELPGRSIPIVPCFGKVMYVREAGATKRVILALISLARDPAMLYSYYRTQQAEMAAMIPKAPVMGYKGQFRGVEQDWESAPHEPIAYLEALERTATTPPGQILPLPQRLAYEAGSHLQALELCAEGARRAIQAAVGISPLPTAAQRQNEKSRVALDKIDEEQQRGSFHFVDHFDEAVTRAAQIIDEQIPTYYDTARDVTVRQPDDTPKRVRINDDQAPDGHIPVEDVDHDVTLSTGPSFESQREAATDFIDHLAENPMFAPRIIDLLTKLKNLGPIGDEMAARLTPPEFRKAPGMENLPPEVRAMVGQSNQRIQELEQLASKLAEEIRTEAVKAQAAKEIKSMELSFQREKLERESETKITVAELGAKVDRLQLFLEERARIGLEMQQVVDQAHAREEAERDRAHAVGQSVLEHTLEQQRSAQDHQEALAQGEASHGQTLEQLAAQPVPPAGGADA